MRRSSRAGRDAGEVPPGLGCTIRVGPSTAAAGVGDTAGPRSVVYGALTGAAAREVAQTLAAVARDHSMVGSAAVFPERGRSRRAAGGRHPARGAAVPTAATCVRRSASDRRASSSSTWSRDGPHAVVAGTTGAGKSELLVSWVLAMAARHPPSAVTFLLVDFKGGAAFAPLARLPHVSAPSAIWTRVAAARAIESLRAELRRRERVLAECGARSIDELVAPASSAQAALVIVVDEFAAVVSDQPELHELFADLAARGRSLGLHLILCTQRPSGVVRDARARQRHAADLAAGDRSRRQLRDARHGCRDRRSPRRLGGGR